MNIDIYRQAKFLSSAYTLAQLPDDVGREVAFAGRSNAGKSSVINVIAGVKSLARTSKTPGRTRLINMFSLPGDLRLVDLPGYGFARVPITMRKHWAQVLNAYFIRRKSLRGLVLIVDIRRQLTDFDTQMLDWSHASGLPVHVLLNKSDKLSKNRAQQAYSAVRQQLGKPGFTVQLFSALKRTGIDAARTQLDEWLVGGD